MDGVRRSVVGSYHPSPVTRSPIVRPYRGLLRRPSHELVGSDLIVGARVGVAAELTSVVGIRGTAR